MKFVEVILVCSDGRTIDCPVCAPDDYDPDNPDIQQRLGRAAVKAAQSKDIDCTTVTGFALRDLPDPDGVLAREVEQNQSLETAKIKAMEGKN
jgi:hypothetical protein